MSPLGAAKGRTLGFSFAKLPHPLDSTLRDMTAVDGLQVEALLDFLAQALKMKEFPGMTDLALMELIALFRLKPLCDRVMDCLRRQTIFDELHAGILNFFVPLRVVERLKVQSIFRPQSMGESLSQFISEIRAVGQVLRLGMPDPQLGGIVLHGLNPEERSKLVFAPRPSSFADLEQLVVLSRSVQDAGFQRGQEMGHRPQPAPQFAAVAPVGRSARMPREPARGF